MDSESNQTYSVTDAIRKCQFAWQQFSAVPHRIEGILSVTGYGACLRDTVNSDDFIHIPGSWIYNAFPTDIQRFIGSVRQYSGQGAVTGKLRYGGLEFAGAIMSEIESFEFFDSEKEPSSFGPFTEQTAVEVFGRVGRNAVLRWLGDTDSPMITIDLQTLYDMKLLADKLEGEDEISPSGRLKSKIRRYWDKFYDTLVEHDLISHEDG